MNANTISHVKPKMSHAMIGTKPQGVNNNDEIGKVDYALLDATFFANGEIPNRDMSEIPHPFVEASMKLFKNLSVKDKSTMIFT